MLDKIKDVLKNDKKTIIIICVLLIAGVVAWDVFRPIVPSGGGTASEVESNIRSTGTELNGAGQAITNSQSISGEIRRANQNIEQSNKSIRQSIESSQSINKSSHDLIREGQQILSVLPRTDEK